MRQLSAERIHHHDERRSHNFRKCRHCCGTGRAPSGRGGGGSSKNDATQKKGALKGRAAPMRASLFTARRRGLHGFLLPSRAGTGKTLRTRVKLVRIGLWGASRCASNSLYPLFNAEHLSFQNNRPIWPPLATIVHSPQPGVPRYSSLHGIIASPQGRFAL
jgi:hypothetical protein